MRTILGSLVLASIITAASTAAASPLANDPIAGFYTSDDMLSHAVLATTDGRVRELYWNGAVEESLAAGSAPPVSDVVLAHYTTPIVGISGHFSAFDGYRHAIVALTDGTVHEVYWKGGTAIIDQVLFTVPATYGAVAQIASYATPDLFQHVLVLTTNDSLYQYRWSPYCTSGCGTTYGVIDFLNGARVRSSLPYRISGYVDSQRYEHTIVAWTSGGSPFMDDLAYGGSSAPSGYPLPNVVNTGAFTQVAAFHNGLGYVDNWGNPYPDTVVGGMHDTVSGDFIEEYALTPNASGRTTDCEGGLVPSGIVGIGGFAEQRTPVWVKHVVVAAKNGAVSDYWRDNVKNAAGNYHFRQVPLGAF